MRRWVLPLLLLAALAAAWQIAASNGAIADLLGIKPFLVPSTAEVASALWESRSLLAENAWVTLREILLGFGCALLVGLCFAVAMRLSETLRLAAYPLVVASQTIPIIVIAPILVTWFGFGIVPKILIVALICFFPIAVTSLDGLRSVDPEMLKLMRTLEASRWQTFRRVEIPTALPASFSGAKVAVVIAPIGAVFAEWTGASSGLGHMILQDNAQLEVAREFAAIVVLSAIALVLFAIVSVTERLVVTWR